ncbi:MAG: TIGR03790 family protein, partial [bacterium]
FGCSRNGIPTSPTEFNDLPSTGSIGARVNNSNREIIGAYIATINPLDGSIVIEPAERIGEYHFELSSSYPHVVSIIETGYDPSHNNDFYADIRLSHPFPNSGIDGFDPRIIAVLPANSVNNSVNFPSYDVLANYKVVREPDGYTKLFDKWNLAGNTNPLMSYFKNEDHRRFSSTGNTSETIRWYLDLSGFTSGYQFYLVCDVSTGFPNPPTPVDDNAPEPVQVDVSITGELYANGGYANIEATIIDWQGTEYVTVGIECPPLFDGITPFTLVGPGTDPDSYVYSGEIGNYKFAQPGDYFCLIHAFDGWSAKGTYKLATITVQGAVATVFDDVYFDFSILDVKEIHVTGNGFEDAQGSNQVWVDGETTGFTVSSWRFDNIAIQIPNDNLDHNVQFDIGGILHDVIPVPESEAILLIYNVQNSDSVAIKDYYASDVTGRNIGADMIFEMSLSLGESINRVQYVDQIKTPVETHILNNNLKYRIKYVVLTKGIPLKISATHGSDYSDLDYAAIDSEMTLLFSNPYNLDGRTLNPYYGSPAGRFYHPFKYNWGAARMSYLVTRLAAWDLVEVYGLIDRALDPYSGPDAYAIMDGGKSYDRMEAAQVIYDSMGFNYLFENGSVFLTAETIADPSISDNVIAYTGHGVHHSPSPPGGGLYVFELGFGLLNGAIFNTYESSNGTTFNEASRSSHGMVGDWIRIGGTGGIGHVYEPWSDAVGDERFLYPRQVAGHNLAESCYMACRYISWTETIVGDPLVIINIE